MFSCLQQHTAKAVNILNPKLWVSSAKTPKNVYNSIHARFVWYNSQKKTKWGWPLADIDTIMSVLTVGVKIIWVVQFVDGLWILPKKSGGYTIIIWEGIYLLGIVDLFYCLAYHTYIKINTIVFLLLRIGNIHFLTF